MRKAIQGTGTFIAAYGVRMSVVRQIMGHVGDIARRLACREAKYLQKRIESACPIFQIRWTRTYLPITVKPDLIGQGHTEV